MIDSGWSLELVVNKVDYRFPWREGNYFRLLINGLQFFPAMLDAIAAAREQVVMEMYLIRSGRVADRFVRAFVDAARRGIRVQLLLDAFGSRGFTDSDRQRLADGGVELALYNPLRLRRLRQNLFRTHRKLLVVDGAVAYVGGAGLDDVFDGDRGWRETEVEIRGPVVEDWQRLFAGDWERWSGRSGLPVKAAPPRPEGPRGRVACSRGPHDVEIKRAFLARIYRARERVWLATAYFVPSLKLRRALRRAARRGVDVCILLPGPITDHPAVRYASRRFYARLLRHGVRIFEYQERFMHTKVALADGWTTIGSSNMDRWNLRWNLEANQEIEDRTFTRRVRTMLQEDFRHCEEIAYHQWRHRSRLQRMQEWLWGRVDLWLAQWRPHRSGTVSPMSQSRRRRSAEQDATKQNDSRHQ